MKSTFAEGPVLMSVIVFCWIILSCRTQLFCAEGAGNGAEKRVTTDRGALKRMMNLICGER